MTFKTCLSIARKIKKRSIYNSMFTENIFQKSCLNRMCIYKTDNTLKHYLFNC